MMFRSLALMILASGLTGCGESVEDRIKRDEDHIVFLGLNDANEEEICEYSGRIRDGYAELKNKQEYQRWSKLRDEACQ